MTDEFADLAIQQRELKAWVDALPPAELPNHLGPLTDRDYSQIGKLLQAMCFADFNIRRAANALQATPGRKRGALKVYRMQDSQVLQYLPQLVTEAELPDDEKSSAIEALKFCARVAGLRHHLAHWATLRLPQGDAFIMMTMNAKEGERRSGLSSEEDAMTYGILFASDLDRAVTGALRASDALAELVPAWYERFIQV